MLDNLAEKPLFTIVLPCYNPIGSWHENVVQRLKAIEKQLDGPVALVLVNDGSTQNVEVAKLNYIKSHHTLSTIISYSQNKGKGYALRQGVEKVEQYPIIYTDIDFPYTLESLCNIFSNLQQNHSVVLGKRNNDYYSNTPLVRKIISKTLRGVLKTFLRLPTDDTQCGIKGFNKAGAGLFLSTQIDRFLFDLEFVKLVSKRKLDCITTDVELKPNIVFSKVNLKILLKESLNFVRVLFRK